jgi:hypothetical protein
MLVAGLRWDMGDTMVERRSEERRRTLLPGRLAVDHLRTLDCVVRDTSERGARLLCRAAFPNDLVMLEINAAAGFKRKARMVWRRLEDCGVEFV